MGSRRPQPVDMAALLWSFRLLEEFPTELFRQLLDPFQSIVQILRYYTLIGLFNPRRNLTGQPG
jgi:hypothetical protein